MKDAFENYKPGLTTPLIDGFNIDPSDSADHLEQVTRAIYVGTAGDLAVTLSSGATITFRNLQAGTIYPLRIRRVSAAGTTALDLVGLS